MENLLTLSISFKLTHWQGHAEKILSLCSQYSRCLKDGMTALIAQNELNASLPKEDKKPSGLTVSRQAMPKEFPSNMKDSACNEVASTWKSYSALWDKQYNRSFPTFKGDGFRFRLRERSLTINHEERKLTISLPEGVRLTFGFLGSSDMFEALKNCKHGAFDVFKSRKGDWFIRIFCKIAPQERRNLASGPIVTIHTGMNFCVTALAAYQNGSYRFLFVPYFPLWGAKKKKKNLRRSLQSKGKLSKIKLMGEKEYRIGNWYYHTVTKMLSQWIAEQGPRDVVLGEHKGIRSKSKKSNFKPVKQQNYWLSNYAFRSILEKLKYKLLMAGIEFSVADTFKLKTTRTCSKCDGETFGLENRVGRLCKECGKTIGNEWNALKNLLPKNYRSLRRNRKPLAAHANSWHRCSIIESDLKRNLNSLCQKSRKVAL